MSWFTHWFTPHESNNQRAKLLHPSALVLLIGVYAIFQIGLGQATRTFPQILGYASQISPDEIIRLTNLQRQSNGLSPVVYDAALSAAAAQKAADMVARDYWAHVSPIGTQPWYFITEAGYSYRYAGENLARDFSSPDAVVSAWMASPSHKDNLLSDKYKDIGVAVIDGKLGGQDTTLVVQMFGTKLAYTAPSIAKTSFTVKAADNPVPTLIPQTPVTVTVTVTPEPPTPTEVPVVMAKQADTAHVDPLVSPFSLTKALSLGILVLIIGVLTIDVIAVSRRKIVRWTSRSVAHLAFMVFLLISAIIIYRGQIV